MNKFPSDPVKTCIRCGVVQPLTSFYAHPKMADGRLGACKICVRASSAARHLEKMSTPAGIASERERQRFKMRRYRAGGKEKKQAPAIRAGHLKKWVSKNRTKQRAELKARRAHPHQQPCEVCGATPAQRHHEDYSKPTEIVWLCSAHHAARHVQMREASIAGATA